jgi:cellulose synthase/poly-beta-1,6-N-acetylglucosamine synthase-like glycosyltransferase
MRHMLSAIVHLLILIIFANRYFVGTLLKRIGARKWNERVEDWEPEVSIVVPMFNEGERIVGTIDSLAGQDYPADKFEIVVVDDKSTDDSYAWACRAAERHPNVRVIQNPVNLGKRKGINRAVRQVSSEIVVSVDSDVVVEDDAVRKLVACFVEDDIAAVGGRVNVLNKHENWLTRMQAIKYFFGYEYLKNVERAHRRVMCLSGCLTAYRRHVLIELEPILERRNVLGVPIKYGEDRFLTRQIIKAGYKTVLTLDAVSHTVAPSTLGGYFSQQIRWRRSNMVDYIGGVSHAWKLPPVVSLHYFSLFALLLVYPAVIFESLLTGSFWNMALVHLAILAAFGTVYRIHTHALADEEKVHPLNFLWMGIVMPVTYVALTPLALFTLDSGSWETRGHQAGGDEELAELPAPAALNSSRR